MAKRVILITTIRCLTWSVSCHQNNMGSPLQTWPWTNLHASKWLSAPIQARNAPIFCINDYARDRTEAETELARERSQSGSFFLRF